MSALECDSNEKYLEQWSGDFLQKSTLCLIMIRRKHNPVDKNAQSFYCTIILELCNMLKN